MIGKAELYEALDASVQRQIGDLFNVLCLASDPPEAIKRFEKGLQKVIDSETAAHEVISYLEL